MTTKSDQVQAFTQHAAKLGMVTLLSDTQVVYADQNVSLLFVLHDNNVKLTCPMPTMCHKAYWIPLEDFLQLNSRTLHLLTSVVDTASVEYLALQDAGLLVGRNVDEHIKRITNCIIY